MRILKSHPLLKLINAYIIDSPTPSNLSYQWNFGSLLGFCLVIQIITGVTLAMHYNPSAIEAFNSVEHIMRDVNNGWLIRYLHSNTASAFFFIVYLHIGRGLYYGSYKEPRTLVWTIGTVIFILMIATAFLGYVLPYGQMSLWGATVITNLMSAIPWVGQDIVEFIWGGFSVNNATLNRFFALHFVLPFVLAALALTHLIALHDSAGSGNPLGVSANCDRLSFAPYFLFKDLITILLFILILSVFVFFMPNLLGDSENYVVANPMQTPPSIVPEWYLLSFYAVLRSIPNKFIGVIAMFSAIVILLSMPFADLSRSRGIQFKPLNKVGFFLFVGNFLILMKLGAKHVESPFIEFGQFSTFIYFSYFLLLIPVSSLFENSLSETNYSIKIKTIIMKIIMKIDYLIQSIRNFIHDALNNHSTRGYSLFPVILQSSILPNVNTFKAKLLIIPFYIYKGIRKIELFKVIKLSLKDLYNSLSISFIIKIVRYSILMRVAIIIATVLCFYLLGLSLITINFIVTGLVISSILYSTYKKSRLDVHLWIYNLTRLVPILIFVCILWYIVSLVTPFAISLFFILGPDFVDSYTLEMDSDWYNYYNPQDPNMGQPSGQPTGQPGYPGPYNENTGMYENQSQEDLRNTSRSPSPPKDITFTISQSDPGTLYVAAEGNISDEAKLKHVQDVFGEIFSRDRNGNMIHQGGAAALHIANGPLWSSSNGDYHCLVVNKDIAELEAKNKTNYILDSDWMSNKSQLRNHITLVNGEAVLNYGHRR